MYLNVSVGHIHRDTGAEAVALGLRGPNGGTQNDCIQKISVGSGDLYSRRFPKTRVDLQGSFRL